MNIPVKSVEVISSHLVPSELLLYLSILYMYRIHLSLLKLTYPDFFQTVLECDQGLDHAYGHVTERRSILPSRNPKKQTKMIGKINLEVRTKVEYKNFRYFLI